MNQVLLSSVAVFFLLGTNVWAGRCVDLEKEVSVDGGLTWHDADTPELAPAVAVGQEVEYRLIVSNCGSTPLKKVTINDAVLGIVDYPVGTLQIEAAITLYKDELPALGQPDRCSDVGEKENIANVVAIAPDGDAEDNDPAWVKCIDVPVPCIDIEKLVSVDGGDTWYDADTEVEAVEAELWGIVQYKLVVSNCGAVDLEDVTINDAVLGIAEYMLGDLAAGDSVVLDGDDLPELDQPERCAEPGVFQNVAGVSGLSAVDATEVTDSDPAWVKCLKAPPPCIDIEKLVSVDDGDTWYDADTEVEAVEAELWGVAQYKLVVSNCGAVDLEDVTINDAVLGITEYMLGDLPAGATTELDGGDLPELEQPERCAESGLFQNVAGVSGLSVVGAFQGDLSGLFIRQFFPLARSLFQDMLGQMFNQFLIRLG